MRASGYTETPEGPLGAHPGSGVELRFARVLLLVID
jgi:hypothetical protein